MVMYGKQPTADVDDEGVGKLPMPSAYLDGDNGVAVVVNGVTKAEFNVYLGDGDCETLVVLSPGKVRKIRDYMNAWLAKTGDSPGGAGA